MAMDYEWAGSVKEGGAWLMRLRERLDLKQRQVDKISGVSAQNISSLENGAIAKPSMPMLCALGAVYGVTPNQIAEAYGWWRPPTKERRDERMVYLESVLMRLDEGHRQILLQQVEAMARLSEREHVR